MHKKCFHSHFYTNFLEALYRVIEAASFLYPWFLIDLKLRSSSLGLHQVVPTWMAQMLFSQIYRHLALTSEGQENP